MLSLLRVQVPVASGLTPQPDQQGRSVCMIRFLGRFPDDNVITRTKVR
jgi:hypothetical protein